MPRPLKLDRAGKLKLSEADVVRQVEDFLLAHGWRVFSAGYGEVRRGDRVVATVGEVGQPDRMAYRPKTGSYCDLLWIEFKRPKSKGDSGGRVRKEQRDWLAAERLREATCLVVDDLVGFMDWYRKEGFK